MNKNIISKILLSLLFLSFIFSSYGLAKAADYPPAPEKLTGTSVNEGNKLIVRLDWSQEESSLGYRITRKEGEEAEKEIYVLDPDPTGVELTTGGTIDDDDVKEGVTYTYFVYSFDVAGAESKPKKVILVAGSTATVTPPPSPPGAGGGCTNQVNTEFGFVCDLGDFVNKFMTPLIGILGGAAFLMMIIAGYIYMTSQGDESKITLAKDLIIGVITGILLLFLIGLLMNQLGAI